MRNCVKVRFNLNVLPDVEIIGQLDSTNSNSRTTRSIFYSRKLKKRVKAGREASGPALILLGLCRNWVSLPHKNP